MKYKLLKKWHPSQVEEVGHVFEEDEHSEIESSDLWRLSKKQNIPITS